MSDTITNPLTDILKEAEEQVRLLEDVLYEEFGLPLYVEVKKGSAALDWPSDPESIGPEEMQWLVDTRGEAAVNDWLMRYYETKMQADAVAAEGNTNGQ